MNRKTRIPMFIVSIVAATVHMASAGSIDPPLGPVLPTHKTLSEVEPRVAVNATNTPGDADSLFKITQPGSYYLTGNITGVGGKMGIEIAASGVTLDLMGFDLLGLPGSLDGVFASVPATDIAVVNGSIRNWGGDGVDLNLPSLFIFNIRLADLRVSGNGNNGIFAGTNTVVTNCLAYSNLNAGVNVLTGTITDCSARENNGIGIIAGFGSMITNCSAFNNTGDGISADSGNTITNCSAESNTGVGIRAGAGNTITNCTALVNTGDGISVSVACTVRGNSCRSNGIGSGDGAGIHATSSDNRIEGNNCTGNDRGIDVDSAGNFITRNTCSGNTINNWDIVAGNVCLVVSATTSAAIVGNSGGVAPGSTDPNANFSY